MTASIIGWLAVSRARSVNRPSTGTRGGAFIPLRAPSRAGPRLHALWVRCFPRRARSCRDLRVREPGEHVGVVHRAAEEVALPVPAAGRDQRRAVRLLLDALGYDRQPER